MTGNAPSAGPVSDVAGIGFGPANLAVAIALVELQQDHALQANPTMTFLEKQPRFGWHRGMLIQDATMQVSFLKDLALMRNPCSRYTFICYLHSKGRLADFINTKSMYPLRVEYNDYLEWAANHFEPLVSYNYEVVEILPVVEDGVVEYLDVTGRRADGGGDTIVRRARNVVLGEGLVPHLPAGVHESPRMWHTARLVERLDGFARDESWRFAVVGSGQSAAEALDYLHRTFPRAEVSAIFARYGYSVADDNPFANGIFDPQAVDEFFVASDEVKQMLLDYHGNTNYSVVDLDLAQELYRRTYQEGVLGRRRLTFFNISVVRGIEEHDDGVVLDVEFLPTGAVESLVFDAVVYATGYRPADPLQLLTQISSECQRDAAGRLALDRDYRVNTSAAIRCGIYLHGAGAEHSHGLSAGLLSNIAVRAGEIALSIIGRTV